MGKGGERERKKEAVKLVTDLCAYTLTAENRGKKREIALKGKEDGAVGVERKCKAKRKKD